MSFIEDDFLKENTELDISQYIDAQSFLWKKNWLDSNKNEFNSFVFMENFIGQYYEISQQTKINFC
jgi:hypothetical protein